MAPERINAPHPETHLLQHGLSSRRHLLPLVGGAAAQGGCCCCQLGALQLLQLLFAVGEWCAGPVVVKGHMAAGGPEGAI
jgi:hypothetical protein